METKKPKYHGIWYKYTIATTFYDLKVTFGYLEESPENFMSKYTQDEV